MRINWKLARLLLIGLTFSRLAYSADDYVFYRWQARPVAERLLRVGEFTEQLLAHLNQIKNEAGGPGLYVAGDIHSAMGYGGLDPALIEVHVPSKYSIGTSRSSSDPIFKYFPHLDWYVIRKNFGVRFKAFDPCRLSAEQFKTAMREGEFDQGRRHLLEAFMQSPCRDLVRPEVLRASDIAWLLVKYPQITQHPDWRDIAGDLASLFDIFYADSNIQSAFLNLVMDQWQKLSPGQQDEAIHLLVRPSKRDQLIQRILLTNMDEIKSHHTPGLLKLYRSALEKFGVSSEDLLAQIKLYSKNQILWPEIVSLIMDYNESLSPREASHSLNEQLRSLAETADSYSQLMSAKTDKELQLAIAGIADISAVNRALEKLSPVVIQRIRQAFGPHTQAQFRQMSRDPIDYLDFIKSTKLTNLNWLPPGVLSSLIPISENLAFSVKNEIFHQINIDSFQQFASQDQVMFLAWWMEFQKENGPAPQFRVRRWLEKLPPLELRRALEAAMRTHGPLQRYFEEMAIYTIDSLLQGMNPAELDEFAELIRDPFSQMLFRDTFKKRREDPGYPICEDIFMRKKTEYQP